DAFGPEWPDQLYRLLATEAVQTAAAKGRHSKPHTNRAIGHTQLFPHSANVSYDIPANSALPPTPQTTGDWESMVYPAGQGVGAVRRSASAADIIAQMMTQAYQILAASQHRRPNLSQR